MDTVLSLGGEQTEDSVVIFKESLHGGVTLVGLLDGFLDSIQVL